ncbi:MAG: YmdB family metallophosphoesterase [Clostridia bacterium]|nr:YmdB family metallophosphoesterase [Clostridia bacterium]
MRILCLGDVVGEEGVRFLEEGGRLRKLIAEKKADLTVVNGENSAEGNGISRDSAGRLLDAGADVITGGNHTWKQRDVYSLLDEGDALLRPANYPTDAPGLGYLIADVRGYRVLVMNVAGCVYMEPVAPPHETAARILKNERGRYDLAVCDLHAEATSEKLFFARYFDGKLAAVFGTHTHVQTADEQILPGGTGYITDLGMCGSMNGVLGVKTESVVHKFTVRTPVRFEHAVGNCRLHGALFSVDEKTGRCVGVERIAE